MRVQVAFPDPLVSMQVHRLGVWDLEHSQDLGRSSGFFLMNGVFVLGCRGADRRFWLSSLQATFTHKKRFAASLSPAASMHACRERERE